MMNTTRSVRALIGLSLALAAMLFPLGSQADALVPEFVRITNVIWAGSGCPPDTVEHDIDPEAFTLLFGAYIATAGPGIPITENRKNCQLLVELDFPPGWSFTFFEVIYEGFVLLDKNVFATQRSRYHFQGEDDAAVFQSTFGSSKAPVEKDYVFDDELLLVDFVWSPCGKKRDLIIDTQVRVNNLKNRKGSGLITTDEITGVVEHTYAFKWRKCPVK